MKTRNGHNGTPMCFNRRTFPPAFSSTGKTLTDRHPIDSQEVIFATHVAQGTSNLNSLTKLKEQTGPLRSLFQDSLAILLKSYYRDKVIIEGYQLYQNYPNPFNNSTTIPYRIIEPEKVKLEIFNILGQRVTILVNEFQQPRTYSVKWDANGFASGIYFYRLTTEHFQKTRKLLLIK